jgi:DNA-binding CsgD family transcriptional regulator
VRSADRALLRGAPAVAQAHLVRSAELTPQEETGGHRLLRAAEVAFELGRPAKVRDLLGRVRAAVLPAEDSGRLVALETAFDDGAPGGERLIRRLGNAAREAVDSGDSDLAVNLLIRAARGCYWGAVRDPELLARLRAVSEQVDLHPADARPVLVDAFLSPFSRGASIVGRLESDKSVHGPADPALTGLLAMASFVSGSFEHTVPLTLAAERGLRQQGRLAALTQVLVLRSFAALYLGQWDHAGAASDEALRLAEETEQSTWAACARLGLANLAAIRGRQRLAMRLIGEVQEAAVVSGNVSIGNGLQLTRGLAALGQEDQGLAFEELGRMLDPDSPTYQEPQCAWALDYYAEAAHGVGKIREARVALRRIEDLAQGTPAGGVRRAISLARVWLAEEDEEPEYLAAARKECEHSSPWYRARLDLAHGSLLRRRRRITEARELLDSAHRSFERLDAPAWAARAKRELAATGQTPHRHRPGLWAGLSPQELEIARLAGQGLSNREIGERLYLSHRTVGSHLYRLFPKLGVQSRSQLAAVLAEAADADQS